MIAAEYFNNPGGRSSRPVDYELVIPLRHLSTSSLVTG